MINENLTNDEKSNLDKLNFFYSEKVYVHIKLKRTDNFGKHIFFNGKLKRKLTDTLFLLEERVLGDTEVSIFEIKNEGGVNKMEIRK